MSKPVDNTNPFADLTKMMEQFKVPGFDMNPIIEARRKDMEALVEANQANFAAMQALAGKQGEIMTQAMQGIQDSVKQFAAGKAPDPARQAALAQAAYQKALGDMKDLAEMARKSQVDAMAGITARAAQSMEDLAKLMKHK